VAKPESRLGKASNVTNVFWLLLWLVGSGSLVGCHRKRLVRVVPGPETPNLAASVHGCIVMDRPVGGLEMITLPSKRVVSIRQADVGEPAIWALAGPNEVGKIVTLEDGPTGFALSVQSVSTSARKMIWKFDAGERVGSGLGRNIAISSGDDFVSFLDHCKESSSREIEELGRVCRLQVLDLKTLSIRATIADVLDSGLCWLPAGNQLAYTTAMPRSQVATASVGDNGVRASFASLSVLPVISIFDLVSKLHREVAVGWEPVFSASGRYLLLHGFHDQFAVTEVSSGATRGLNWPGNAGGAITFDEDWVLFLGYPTAGRPVRWSGHNSPLVGKKQLLALKVARPSDDSFETVIDGVDPRQQISFGPCPAQTH
jgi:hypothetical protein